jgi:hypothetical protein
MRKPKGRQGSWFAEWDGEQLPCVHRHWTDGRWPYYLDPNFDERPEWPAFVNALRGGGKAILTTSKIPRDGGSWQRDRYVAVWTVDEVVTEGRELRFKFVNKLIQF